MGWKEQFNRANTRIKNNIKQDAKDKLDLTKQKVEHSSVARFTKQKGLKNKAKFIGKGALNKFKSTNLYQNVKKFVGNVGKVLDFIIANIVPISIISAVLVLGTNIAIMSIGFVQAVGETPHYYCYTNPSDAIKNSKAYKQYCENDTSYIKMDTVNGHYVVQDGPGPCCACSVLNMLIRFYHSNNINIYDFLWQSNGQYAPIGSSIIAPSRDQYNLRLFITGSGGVNDSTKWAANLSTNGSKEFAENHGKPDYTMANWGYLRDPTINGGYTDVSTNENWVWDLSLENDSEGTDWSAQWYNGNHISIEGTKATFVHEDRAFRSLEEFKIILGAHPAGVVVYREYKPGKNHAILVTGYNESTGQFTVVDPALGLMGGFEQSADNCVSSDGVPIFNNAILSNPSGTTNGCNNMKSFTYLEQG